MNEAEIWKMKNAIPSFVGLNQIDDIDKAPFKFGHGLLGHPAMSIENLAAVIPALPSEQVFYSSGKLSKGDNFDRAHIDNKNGLSLEDTINRMMDVDSYIMVRSPEVDPSFKDLFAELKSSVDEVIRLRGAGNRAVDPMLYMFIASPGSITPFHIDRYSTFLLQFRGQKKVSIYPSWDEDIIKPEVLEGFMARTGVRPQYDEVFAPKAQTFDFGPGEAIHIPFVAGHDVHNGRGDISISLSIIFNTKETQRQIEALSFNHLLRNRLKLSPVSVGQHDFSDRMKAQTYRAYSKTKTLFKGQR
ncbi:MAG: transcriptional regulator [Proteobacteria bacterium]|nr:MAG: transcriptional regulator [Pseudomonadota bacterium]